MTRGLSERDLALATGMTVRQLRAVTQSETKPTCAFLIDLAEALDVRLADLMDPTAETSPTPEDMRACLRGLQQRRAALASRMAIQVNRVDRQLMRVRGLLDLDATPNGDEFEATLGLMRAIERSEPLRACVCRYAWLIVQRCDGNKRHACRVLGISYHTLRTYLGSPEPRGDDRNHSRS